MYICYCPLRDLNWNKIYGIVLYCKFYNFDHLLLYINNIQIRILGITDIYLNDNFEPTTPFLSDQKNLILSLNFVG